MVVGVTETINPFARRIVSGCLFLSFVGAASGEEFFAEIVLIYFAVV